MSTEHTPRRSLIDIPEGRKRAGGLGVTAFYAHFGDLIVKIGRRSFLDEGEFAARLTALPRGRSAPVGRPYRKAEAAA